MHDASFEGIASGQAGFDNNYIGKNWGDTFNGGDWIWDKGTLPASSTATGLYAAHVQSIEVDAGSSSLVLGDVGGFSGVSQLVTGLSPSTAVTLSFSMKWKTPSSSPIPSAGDQNALTITINNTLIACFADFYTTTWTPQVVTFTAPSENVALIILAQVLDNYMYTFTHLIIGCCHRLNNVSTCSHTHFLHVC